MSEVSSPLGASSSLRALVEKAKRHEQAIVAYVEWFGGLHDGECPEDDTCDCSGKPINDGVNAACKFLLSLADELSAALDAHQEPEKAKAESLLGTPGPKSSGEGAPVAAWELLRSLHTECLDEGHTDSGDPMDVCRHRGQAIRCGICSTIDDVKTALDRHAALPAFSHPERSEGWQPLEQSEDTEVVNAVTAAMREADRVFEKVGGSTRHHVRDCLLPVLNRNGWRVTRCPALPTEPSNG
jgi:hypothetical protein